MSEGFSLILWGPKLQRGDSMISAAEHDQLISDIKQ